MATSSNAVQNFLSLCNLYLFNLYLTKKNNLKLILIFSNGLARWLPIVQPKWFSKWLRKLFKTVQCTNTGFARTTWGGCAVEWVKWITPKEMNVQEAHCL